VLTSRALTRIHPIPRGMGLHGANASRLMSHRFDITTPVPLGIAASARVGSAD